MLVGGYLLANMRLSIEAGKDSPACAGAAAEHLRIPLFPAGPALQCDGVVDAEEAVALVLRHPAAVVPQWTTSALALRRASLQDLQKTPAHERYARCRRLFHNSVHEPVRVM